MNIDLAELLYDALRTPHGVIVETDDAERLRQKLYAVRRESDDFTDLAFVISPMNGSDLWIVRKTPDAQV